MDQNYSNLYEDVTLLSDCLGEGTEKQWSHALRKQILQLLHKLKSMSRRAKNHELEAELISIEVTLGYGSGEFEVPNISLIEDHQLRLLELAELTRIFPALSPSVDYTEDNIIKYESDDVNIDTAIAMEKAVELSSEPGKVDSNLFTETETETETEKPKIQLILCNCPGRDAARELAKGLVQTRLAACVNIIANIGSMYWWEGEIKDTAECQLQIKTSTVRLEDTLNYIKQNHPNDVPEILSIGVEKGNDDYFEWVKQETSDK
jgi:periplasmic divalent cation tolerance protein